MERKTLKPSIATKAPRAPRKTKTACFGFPLQLSVSPLKSSFSVKNSFLSFHFKHIDKETGEDYDKGVGHLYHLPRNPGRAA